MSLEKFKLLKEDDASYHIASPTGKKFQLDKQGLSEKAHGVIKRMADGGAVEQPWYAKPGTQLIAEGMQGLRSDPANDWQHQRDMADIAALHPQAAAPAPAVAEVPSAPVVNAQAPQDRAPAVVQEDPLIKSKSDMSSLLDQEQSNTESYMADIGKSGAQAARGYKQLSDDLDKVKDPMIFAQAQHAKDEAAAQHFANNPREDQGRIFKNMSTGNKILGAISLALGGIGSAFSGKNSAMDVMTDAINRDVSAQREDKSNEMNVWKMNQQIYQNDSMASLASQNLLMAKAKAIALQAEATAQTPLAKLKAQEMINAIKEKQIANNQYMGLLKQGMESDQGKGNGLSTVDPAYLVPDMVKDPGAQKSSFEEIKNAQNIGVNGPKMLEAFDEAAGDTSGVLGRPASMLYSPGSIKKLKQLMLPNFKDIDGTVRQAAMDESFENIIPSGTDTKARKAQKRQALIGWMHSQTSAPVSKGHGIDLQRYSKTAVPKELPPQKYAEGQTATGPNGAKIVFKMGKWVPM